MATKDQIRAFLTEMTELSQRHGIYLWGCGCHGSPGLFTVDAEGTPSDVAQTLEWDGEEQRYTTDRTWEIVDGLAGETGSIWDDDPAPLSGG